MNKNAKIKFVGIVSSLIIGIGLLFILFLKVSPQDEQSLSAMIIWGSFIIISILYVAIMIKFYNENKVNYQTYLYRTTNIKKEDVSFFIPVIISLIFSCIILLILFIAVRNYPEKYYDIIAEEISIYNTNKSGELNSVWIALIVGSISVILFSKLFNNVYILKERFKINVSEIYINIFGIVIIPTIIIWIITGNFNTYIILIGLIFILSIILENSFKNKFYKENKCAMRFVISIFTTYYTIIGMFSFINSLTGKILFTSRLAQMLTLFCLVIIWIRFFKSKNIKFINNIILIEQIIIPLILCVYLVNRYNFNGEMLKLEYPKNYIIIIMIIIIGLIVYALLKFKRLYKLQKIDISKIILLSTIITIFIFNSYISPNYIYSTDLWHTGENLLPWHQIIEKGMVPYKEYNSEAGLFPLYFGFIHNILLDGTALSYNFAWSLQYVFIGIVNGLLIYYTVGSKFALVIASMFIGVQYNRALIIIPVVLILASEKLISKKVYWIQVWILCCFICGLYYPIYGVAILLGTIPFAFIQLINIVKQEGRLKDKIKKGNMVLGIIEIVIIGLSIPLLFRMAKHIILLSNQSMLADGISALHSSNVPEWFFKGLDTHISARRILYCVFEFSLPIFYSIISTYLIYLLVKKNRKYLKSPLFMLLSVTCIGLPIIYTSAFIRMDPNVLLARAGFVLSSFTSVIIPIMLWKYGRLILTRSVIAILIGISFSTSFLLTGTKIGNETNTIVNSYIVSEDYAYLKDEYSYNNKLGKGFITKNGLNIVQTVSQVMDFILKDNEKIFIFSGNQALYYIYDQKTLIPDAAIWVPSDGRTQMVDVDILGENPPMLIQWEEGLSIRNYYIYYWMIDNGYLPYTVNDVKFFVHPDRYREKIGDISLAKKQLINEYDTTYFSSKYLVGLANSWGKSMDTLDSIFNVYKNFNIDKLNITANNITYFNNNGNRIYDVNYENSSITIDFEENVYGKDSDFLYINLNFENEIKESSNVSIYWMGDETEIDNKRSFNFNIGSGELLIPLGAHPGWLLNKNRKICIEFNDLPLECTFYIKEMKLLKLNQEQMRD